MSISCPIKRTWKYFLKLFGFSTAKDSGGMRRIIHRHDMAQEIDSKDPKNLTDWNGQMAGRHFIPLSR